jgi:hypothetical protein
MKITELPHVAALQEFELQRVDHLAPEAGGRLGGVQAGEPLWMGVWSVARIGRDRSDELRGWWIGQRGAIRRFHGRDFARPYPKAYPQGFAGMVRAAGGAFDGSATGWSEAIDADQDSRLTLQGLPAGLVLATGDYVGFRWLAASPEVAGKQWRTMVRVSLGGGSVANGAGAITVTVEPSVPRVVPLQAVAFLDRPSCIMAKVSERSKLEAIDRRRAVRGGTIVGVQDLRP